MPVNELQALYDGAIDEPREMTAIIRKSNAWKGD
ncbi:Hypothetical protein NGAL_HAMBI490_26180 [Neorhizobium galegae bv. officinalis]|nr:Hypothetical protein NGAL_HAMBI490_26180 [Neorhizobium galegae bv. officinalis]